MAQIFKSPGHLVVLGATGTQGGAVLRYFVQVSKVSSQSFRLRSLTRNTSSEAAQALERAGVEMVAGDLDDQTSLRHAFAGATHIFANMDSNRPMFDE